MPARSILFRSIVIFSITLVLIGCKKQRITNKGCSGEMIVLTENYDTSSVRLYVPNVFTPNGDGINDIFSVKSIGIKDMNLKIYKGLSLKHELTGPKEYWNGKINEKIRKGKYKYKGELTSIHNEKIEIEGEFYVLNDPDDPLLIEIKNCEKCIFPDMIDPELGVYYPTSEQIECKE